MNERENTARKPLEDDGYKQPNNDSRLVDTDFVENQGLSSKATDFSKKRVAAANDAQYREEAANEERFAQEQMQQAIEESRSVARRAVARKQASFKQNKAASIAGKARGATSLARWAGTGVAGTIWFWQFVCSVTSLIGFATWATIEEVATGTILGRVSNWILGVFGSSLQSLFPAEYIAFGFWGIAALIGMFSFFGFLIWFYVTGAKVFDTPVVALATILTFIFSVLPFSNIFPWIPVWVFFINLRSTLGSLRALRPSSSDVMGGV